MCVGPQAVVVSENSGRFLEKKSLHTNDAAEGACCKVVAAE